MVQMRMRRDERTALLKGVNLLSGCNGQELRRLASLSTEVDTPSGTVLAEKASPETNSSSSCQARQRPRGEWRHPRHSFAYRLLR